MSFANDPLGGFLESLASKSPTPGGGAVACVTGAMAAGLFEMVLNYSLIKRLEAHRPAIEDALHWTTSARAAFLASADFDAAAYRQLNELMKIQARTPEQERGYRMVLTGAIKCPAGAVHLSRSLLERIDALGDRWNHNLESDLAISAILAAAAARSAWWNVRANEPLVRAAGICPEVMGEADAELAQAEELARRIESRVRGLAAP